MPASDTRSRERWIVAALVVGLVLWRSAVFVFWPDGYFDSDQAVTGLMAKHLSHFRAFPVFWYGQSYRACRLRRSSSRCSPSTSRLR
ncbi:MAG: hypothetical protein DMF86_06830 [Acidobacteria bacterium]|nr:MAG: hypothetical protein DMF86_06830 [Acidobacteriota bacterium]